MRFALKTSVNIELNWSNVWHNIDDFDLSWFTAINYLPDIERVESLKRRVSVTQTFPLPRDVCMTQDVAGDQRLLVGQVLMFDDLAGKEHIWKIKDLLIFRLNYNLKKTCLENFFRIFKAWHKLC